MVSWCREAWYALDHGEFRGVGGVGNFALVAGSRAVDFEHAVDAADEAALQERFGFDAPGTGRSR